MNYAYLPVPGGIQNLHTPFVPQGAIGAQLGQLTGGIGGPLLPGPFGGFASQLLPQLGNVLPFQAGPQQILPQGIMSTPLGPVVAAIPGNLVPSPFGGFASQLIPQLGSPFPFQAWPQQQIHPLQGVLGYQLSQLGGIAGQYPQVPLGVPAHQILPQFGVFGQYHPIPSYLPAMGGYALTHPFFNAGVQW